jgi:hypothetical protein
MAIGTIDAFPGSGVTDEKHIFIHLGSNIFKVL